MIVKYKDISRGERTKNVNGNNYLFKLSNGSLICKVPEPDCQVFLRHNALYEEFIVDITDNEVNTNDDYDILGKDAKLKDIDTSDIDAVIAFANSVQDEVRYTRRNKRENILAILLENGY